MIGNTIQSIIYKMLALEHKITLLEYMVLRNFAIVLIAIVGLIVKNIEPFEALPSEKRGIMIGRAFFGFSVSVLINEGLELIPFSLLVILFQTNPFWTSILSYMVNGEKIYAVEAIGMVICFIAVICIAINAAEDNLEVVDASLGDVEMPEDYEEQ